MIHAQNAKWLASVKPAILVDDATLALTEIDTLGFRYMEVILFTGATDIGVTTMKLTEGDTSGSGHVDITASIWGTADNSAGATSTLPSATDDGKIFIWQVNLKGRKRYIDAVITIGDGTVGGYYSVLTRLSRTETAPDTAAEAGIDGELLRL